MEPVGSECPTSQTDIVNAQIPSPVTSNAGSDCSISNPKVIVAAKAAVEKRDDVTLKLMGHLIPGSTRREEDSDSETDSSIESTSSALKRRLKNLPPPSKAVKLAAVNLRVRREQDLYLHLQGLTNRIEEKDEPELTISTTDSSRTLADSESNRRHQGQVSKARARRRERLNSSIPMSQHQQSSDAHLCSSGLSSPEPLTMREMREYFHGETKEVPSTIDRYRCNDDPIVNLKRDDTVTGPSNSVFREAGEANSEFEDVHPKEELIRQSSPEVENILVRATYVTPTKFGGYRPTSGLIFRNVSSDSESEDTTALKIQDAEEQTLRGRDFDSRYSFSKSGRMMQVEPFSMEVIKVLESSPISPVPSADSRLSLEESNLSQRLATCSELRIPQETAWESLSSSERNHYLDSKIGNVVERNTLVDSPVRHFDNGQLMEVDLTDTFSREDFTYGKSSKISLEPLHQNHLNCPRETSFKEHSNLVQSGHDPTNDVTPKIPPLEIDYSQSQSLSSDARDDTTRSSLDVSALIQALSDISIKREKNATYRTNRSILKLKSPLGYGYKFSGSSGPRSSEYTPAGGGSRQSLTSQETSETHSVRNCKAELNKKSGRLSSRSPKADVVCARNEPLENDLSRGSGYIPVVAKVNKTNLVCPKHPLRVTSIGKLISPRKYPNYESREKIVDSFTSRTDVSQSSEECQKSFRSLKSVQKVSKASDSKRIDTLRPSIDSPSQPGTLSGRRILEPLNSVPKIQPDVLTNLNKKFNRRRKAANDLAEVISSQSGSERTTRSSRKSPSSQINRTDVPIHRFAKRRENSSIQPKDSSDTRSKIVIHHTEIISGSRTPGEPFANISQPTTEHDHELLKHSLKGGKSSCASSPKSSLTSGNMLYLRSERRSMNSGDYEGRTNWSSPARDDDLTGNDETYDLEDRSYDQQQGGENCTMTSGVIDPNSKDARSPKFAPNSYAQESARSFRNCVHLNDLQDGREVVLPCRDAGRQENHLREKELFQHLPNEISAFLTRHGSFGTRVAENLHSSKEIPNTFEDLRKNIQDNNDQWIKNFKSDNDLRHAPQGNSSEFSPDDKLVSSASSPVRFRNSHNQSRNLIRNQTKIPLKIPFVDLDSHRSQVPPQKIIARTEGSCFRASMSGRIDIRQKSEYNSEIGQLDSQRSLPINSGANSHRNTNRSVVESVASTTVRKFDERLDQKVNKVAGQGITILDHDVETIEPSKISKFESCITETVANSKCHSILNTALGCPESKELKELSVSEKDHEQDKEQSTIVSSDKENRFLSELQDQAFANLPDDSNLTTYRESGFVVCGQNGSPNSNKSTKSQISSEHTQDAVISSPVKSLLSVSNLNSSTDSKWDVTIMQSGANILRKSQDRFPFTISESASRKVLKYKVVADVSLGEMIQEQNAHVGCNDAVITQQPILEKLTDGESITSDMIDTKPEIESCNLTPFLEELTNKISNDFPQRWTTEIPFTGPNYMSYGCRPEARALMPTMKEIVKKFSAKLRYSRAKRCRDSEETNVEILYRNKKCRYESAEGSSSAASLYQSQFPTTNKLIRESTDDSRSSSANAVKPKRNHECINMSIKQHADKGCDQNDMWIQEFDSDEELDDRVKREATPRTCSPVNDRYSVFLARRKFSGIINGREGGDNEKVTSKMTNSGDKLFSKMQDLVLKSPMPPPNSTNEFEIQTSDDDFDHPNEKTGCCCLGIYHFFATFKKHGSQTRRRTKVWEIK